MAKEILMEQMDELRQMPLPPEWKVSRLEVTFEREGILGEWGSVIYDNRNDTFYVKTNKSIIYPDDTKATQEAIKIMEIANKIIKSK